MAVSTAAPSIASTPDAPPVPRYPLAAGPPPTWPALVCAEPEAEVYRAPRRLPPAAAPAAVPFPAPTAYPVESALLQADRIALSIRAALERTALPVARTATTLVAAKAWTEFGFARLDDYAREHLGRSGRWLRDLATLGDALTRLPALAAALTGSDGARPLGRVAALLIARVATPASLADWITTARALSIRALRDAVRAAAPQVAPGTGEADAAPADATASDPDDVAERVLVRVSVPAPVLAAFDEAVDLYRAVEGGEASVTSFVEALVAESAASGDAPAPFDAPAHPDAPNADPATPNARPPARPAGTDARVLQSGPATAALERALTTSTRNWAHLPDHVEASWALSLAGVTLARFNALAAEAAADPTTGDRDASGHRNPSADRDAPAALDHRLRALIAIENELESRLGVLLADLADRRAWPRLRFAGVGHYGEERLGLSRSAAEDRARLARDLRRFPHLRAACAAGQVTRDAAALVARILRDAPAGAATPADGDATPAGAAARSAAARSIAAQYAAAQPVAAQTAAELAWVARASESTIKRLRDEARALGRYKALAPRHGTGPTTQPAQATPASPSPLPGPTPLTDSEWHVSLRRAPGLARRRIARFGALALASPDVFHPGPAVTIPDVFQALPHEADAYLRLRLPLDLGDRFLAAIDAARRRLTAEADAIPWDEAAPDPSVDPAADGAAAPAADANADAPAPPRYSHVAARMFSIRCRVLPSWVGLLALLEDFADTWDDPDANPRRPGDEIYIRDGWRCMAPGCTSRRNLESHHLRYRSRGGGDESPNLICLCRFHHHRGEHGDLASCRGRAPTDVEWRLGRASAGTVRPSDRASTATWYRNERRVPAPLLSSRA